MKDITETNNSVEALVKHGCSQIRLFGFYPDGHGPFSFFVAAASLNEARQMVDEYIQKNLPIIVKSGLGNMNVPK